MRLPKTQSPPAAPAPRLSIPTSGIRSAVNRSAVPSAWLHVPAEVFRRVPAESRLALLFPTLPPDDRKTRETLQATSRNCRDPAAPTLAALDTWASLNYLSWNAATRTLRSGLYENSVEHLRDALALLKECGIRRSTLQVFDATFLRTILLFLEQGILSEPLMIKVLLPWAGTADRVCRRRSKGLEAYLEISSRVCAAIGSSPLWAATCCRWCRSQWRWAGTCALAWRTTSLARRSVQ